MALLARVGTPGVGTVLSPIPCLLQRAPSFRLSHREGQNLEMRLGTELYPHHFLLIPQARSGGCALQVSLTAQATPIQPP